MIDFLEPLWYNKNRGVFDLDETKNTDALEELYITYYPMYFEKCLNDVCKYGERIRKKREALNLPLRQLARKLAISHSQLSKIENGNTAFINIEILQMISEEIKCSPLYLLAKSDFEKCELENYCYTNPYTNQKLLSDWYSNIEHSTCRKIFIGEKEFEMPDFRIRSLIDIAKEHQNGIRLHIDNKILHLTYITKKYYVTSTSLHKDKYVEYTIASGKKNNSIVKNLPNDSADFFLHKDFNDCLIIQNCSPVQWLVQKVNNVDINLLYHQKLTEVFQKGFMQYTNYNLIDYLFELRQIEQFDENRIIRNFTRILHRNEVSHSFICKLTNQLLLLQKTDLKNILDLIQEIIKGYKDNKRDSKDIINLLDKILNRYNENRESDS